MSFRAYIRKLQSSSAGERTTFAQLENTSCSIKDKCATGHAPWPKGNYLFEMKDRLTRFFIGICTKCQPNPVTLMRQVIMQSDEI